MDAIALTGLRWEVEEQDGADEAVGDAGRHPAAAQR